MCGISGVFSTSSPPGRSELKKMNRCQRHRGPDSEGYFLEGALGLAHSRLSIVGVESGDQPIENEDGSVVVIFNGEIYNYPKLYDHLQNKGHQFTTETDTEVLVHLYEEYGASFVDRLEGMFAFALWDRETSELILARDPIGIKPLLVANDGERIAFASELPSILRSEVDQGALDTDAISQYFSLGFVPAPSTAFTNVRKLRPGEQLTISSDGVDDRRFYKPSIDPVEKSLPEAGETLRELVTESVEKRLMSDVPLGTFLSGGIDSTILTGLIAQLQDDPVRTFTVGFESDQFDESDAARTVADYHNTDHHELVVSVDDVREAIPSVLGRLGEPFADPSLIPTYIVANETSDHVKVALSGDGADELFGGYNRYRGEYYSRLYRSVPRPIRSMLVEPTVNRLPATRSTRIGELCRKGQDFIDVNADNAADRHFEWVRQTSNDTTDAFGNCDPMDAGRTVINKGHQEIESILPPERAEPLDRIMAVDIRHGLPNQMLQKVDLASMYNSLEVRVPFLDTAVVEYGLGLPREFKITARDRKRILKSAFDDVIPQSVISRNKQGFEMPIGEWLKDELEADFKSVVADLHRTDQSLLDGKRILSLYNDHTSGRKDYEWLLWNVYVFGKWHARMREQGHLA